MWPLHADLLTRQAMSNGLRHVWLHESAQCCSYSQGSQRSWSDAWALPVPTVKFKVHAHAPLGNFKLQGLSFDPPQCSFQVFRLPLKMISL